MKLCLGLISLVVLAGAILVYSSKSSRGALRPHIVFLFSDDYSLQTIGAYSARPSKFCREQAITPNIDRLAEPGGLFVNSFCGNSLCSPSRASVLTGLQSHANGVMTLDQPIKAELRTFPDSLRKLSDQNAVIGRWHLDKTIPEYADWQIPQGQGDNLDPVFISKRGREKHTGSVTDVTTDLALEWLKQQHPSNPFFLVIHHKAPHRNWFSPPRYATWLNDVAVAEPTTLFDDYINLASLVRLQEMNIGKNLTMASDLKVGKTFAENPLYAARDSDFAAKILVGDDLTRWKYQ